ncbi:MAG: hypothetical protein IPK65_07580 [Gammaproteobacteria bacterium]|nr:hypothetical protein [Gammaproteobacteria bacterium]
MSEPAPRRETPTTSPSEQDTILLEYRRSAERIQAEETLLHQALNRLYTYINRELVPAGKGSPFAEEQGQNGREVDEDLRHPGPGRDDAKSVN